MLVPGQLAPQHVELRAHAHQRPHAVDASRLGEGLAVDQRVAAAGGKNACVGGKGGGTLGAAHWEAARWDAACWQGGGTPGSGIKVGAATLPGLRASEQGRKGRVELDNGSASQAQRGAPPIP